MVVERVMKKLIRHTETLEERLQKFAQQAREAARKLPPGKERTELLKKARQAETTASVNDWLVSAGARAPD